MANAEERFTGSIDLALFDLAVREAGDINSPSQRLGMKPYAYFLQAINPYSEEALAKSETMLDMLIQKHARMSLREFIDNPNIVLRVLPYPIPLAAMWNKIIDSGADVHEPRIVKDSDGDIAEYSLIHDVIRSMRDPLCKLMVSALLRAGVDPMKPTVYGFSLASVAIDGGNDQTLSLLLGRGCTISENDAGRAVSHCTNGAIPGILRAAGIAIKPEYLADAINFNLQQLDYMTRENKNNAFQKMIEDAEVQLMKFITMPGDLNWRGDSSEQWPLQAAIDMNRADIVQKFLERGAVVLPVFSSGNPQISRLLGDWQARNDWREVLLRNGGSYYWLHDLGEKYLVGDGVPQNTAKAVAYFTKAADLGYAESQYTLAMCIMNGEGTPVDANRAVYYFRLAALQHHAEALYYFGRHTMEGSGVAANPAQGFQYLLESARREHNDATYQVGFCYQMGNGVGQNYAQAAYWFTKSALMNDADGMTSLGYLYANGMGVPVNVQLATDLFAAAAAMGHSGARDNLNLCYRNGCRPNPRGLTIPQLIFCPECGAAIEADARFCPRCGKPVR